MVTAGKIELFGIPPTELAVHLGGTGRAFQPWRLLRAGNDLTELDPAQRARLEERCDLTPANLVTQQRASCGTAKLLLRLADGRTVETVVIPGSRRTTACLSTQVGCARGCTFCVTATMGLVRNLSTAEIVSQLHFAQRYTVQNGLPPLRNVVFMGMGEPLDNFDATARAIEVLTDKHGFGMGPSHITLSTVGPSPRAIRRCTDLPVNLAWSLHSVNDDERKELVPTSKHSLVDLRAAFVDVLHTRGADLFVEVTLIHGVNDSDQHAIQMADFLAPLMPGVRVNLLPMNDGRQGLAPSLAPRAVSFRQRLYERGVRCIVRRARGTDMGAACGQLVSSQLTSMQLTSRTA